jgi:hypothetical protein
MIIRMIPGQISGYQTEIRYSLEFFQVYKIILIPHNQQAEIDSRLPL